jgi:hypothetical protein
MAEGLLGLKNGLLDALVLEPVDYVRTSPMNNLVIDLSHSVTNAHAGKHTTHAHLLHLPWRKEKGVIFRYDFFEHFCLLYAQWQSNHLRVSDIQGEKRTVAICTSKLTVKAPPERGQS